MGLPPAVEVSQEVKYDDGDGVGKRGGEGGVR
jgi:hypothetical protein